jgi:hypothetical protein
MGTTQAWRQGDTGVTPARRARGTVIADAHGNPLCLQNWTEGRALVEGAPNLGVRERINGMWHWGPAHRIGANSDIRSSENREESGKALQVTEYEVLGKANGPVFWGLGRLRSRFRVGA